MAPHGGLACPAALLAALLSLALVPPAGALSGFGARVMRATTIARGYFHDRQTCRGGVLASWGRLASLDADRSSGLAAEAFPGACAVVYNSDVFDSVSFGAGSYRWPMFCTLTVHEFGHLTGLGHSADTRSVMYPVIRTPIRACTR